MKNDELPITHEVRTLLTSKDPRKIRGMLGSLETRTIDYKQFVRWPALEDSLARDIDLLNNRLKELE